MQVATPVTLIGGYLGAGKTTLVNHLLRRRTGRRIAVLVNDFGELSIDEDLIETRTGGLLRLAGGCMCCSFGSDLMAALLQLRTMLPAPDHILIETSGVALPGAVARMLSLVPGLRLDAVLVLADAQSLRAQADDRYVGELVRQQLAEADLLLLNKIDRVDAQQLGALKDWLAGVARGARVLPCEQSRLAPALLLDTGAGFARAPPERPSSWPLLTPRVAAAAETFDSISLEFTHAVDVDALACALAAPGMRLLRAKGLLRERDGTTRSLQLVGARVALAASAHARPLVGRLVCVGLRGELDVASIRQALDNSAR
jgi:G3E family GTPase